MHRIILFLSIIAISQLLACGGGQVVQQPSDIQVSGPPVYVQNVIPFDKNMHVRAAVRTECALGTKFSDFIQSYGRTNGTNVLPANNLKDKKGRRLEVRIIHMNDAGGGAWSGAKSVVAEGKLIENGKVIGSFRGSRYSGGGAFGGFKGTCSILGRCVKALGRDISVWLQSPTMNAVLGDGLNY